MMPTIVSFRINNNNFGNNPCFSSKRKPLFKLIIAKPKRNNPSPSENYSFNDGGGLWIINK